MTNTIYITADTQKQVFQDNILVTQNDSGNVFVIKIQNNGQDVPLPTDTVYALTSLRLDRVPIMSPNLGIITGDNEVTFTLGTKELAVIGLVRASVQMISTDGRLSTLSFNYSVVRDLSDVVPEGNDKTLIEIVLGEGPAIIQSAKDATGDAVEATGLAIQAANSVEVVKDDAIEATTDAITATALTTQATADTVIAKDATIAVTETANVAALNADEKAVLAQDAADTVAVRMTELEGVDAVQFDGRLNNVTSQLADTVKEVAVNVKRLSYYEKQALYFANLLKKLANREPIKIVCQGDSMTYGYDIISADKRPAKSDPTCTDTTVVQTGAQAGKTYPEALQEFSNKMYGSGIVTIVNRGFSGDRTDQSTTRWNVNPNADLHFIMLGTNDASFSTNAQKYAEDMSKLVEQILDFGSAVVLLTIPKHSLSNSLITEAFRKSLEVVGEKYKIPVIDSASFLKSYPYSTVQSDGTHYNTKGYTVFGAKVAAVLAGIGTVYNPLELVSGNVLAPSFIDYGYAVKGAVALSLSTIAPLGVGSAIDIGQMFSLPVNTMITIPFNATEDNLVITPIFNVNNANAALNVTLDFGIDIGEFVSPYLFGGVYRNTLNASYKSQPKLSYVGAKGRLNIANERKDIVLANSFHLPSKGLYSISFENPSTSTSNDVYIMGFFIRKYNSLDDKKLAMQVYTTHTTATGNTVVASSSIDPYAVLSNYGIIDGYDGIKSEYWKIPPLKLVVHNYQYSTIEYIIHVGVNNGTSMWLFKEVSANYYNADRAFDRTLSSITFDGTNLTVNWAGATNRASMFTLSPYA